MGGQLLGKECLILFICGLMIFMMRDGDDNCINGHGHSNGK